MSVPSFLRRAALHWPLILAGALFFVLALPNLDAPGLHYDEALEAATPAALLLRGQSFPILNNGALELGRLRLPLMVQNHIGALQIYAAMPFVALFGPTIAALRAMTVLVGALTLVGLYLFMLRAYSRVAAGAAILWLAAFPSFVLWSRQGAFVTNLAPCFAVWAFAVAARFSALGARRTACVVGLLFGVAVWAKLSALWLIIGSVGWGVVVLGKRLTRLRLLSLALGFAAGIAPIVLYNILTGFKTFRAVGASASTTYLGTSNLDVVGNFGTRVQQFADVVVSGQHLWYLGGLFANWWALGSLLLALAVIVVLLVARRGQGWQRDLFLPWLALACIAQSCFTISALWYTHFAIIVWLPAAIVGVAAGALAQSGQKWLAEHQQRLVWAGAILIFMLGVVGPQVTSSRLYLDAAQKTGGLSFHSSAISDVSRFLATRPEHVVALDWGMSSPIEYLTGGQKRVEELYGFTLETPADFAATLEQRFGQGELYLTHTPSEEAFPRRQAFLDAVAAAGLRAETVNISVRRDGVPVIEVWRVVANSEF